ncbi:LytR/AlgR family response regulator transcription factor [Chryseosolibacter indicus]|uniref:LytTR family DNA-binding domain-containing protein n=1 Tax=Chryseosolibacter indicus TaxID=2782351 RepID=A0ABS5VRW6_9BACT|nr:LytTR family DNA-binding domain-containing protein [Chryseosolibacter indicus]MBT1703916.1 LytTR family DNA-binding domain-containing protein [Chryseosolibacter indicus]
MINCIIVDDEPLALDIIESYIRKTPFLNLVARCSGVAEAMKQMERNDVQLLFLDIQMPDVTGLDFSQTLSSRIKVVFTTAFEQYALEGFKVNALGYLLKPFSYKEFLEVANRAKEWFDLVSKSNFQEGIKEDSLFVKSEYKIIKIAFDEINYIEGLKDYVKFHLVGKERPILSLMSLKVLEENLPQKKFMRVHRSFIVNLDKIETIQRNEIIFGRVTIPVAEKYKEQFQEYVKSKSFE